MKTLKLKFVDFWKNFRIENSLLLGLLNQKYNVIISDDPDYLFYSAYGFEHLKYDCIKIFYSAENVVPDFNFCDYGIGFHFIRFQDRYLRIPLFSTGDAYRHLLIKGEINPADVLNRKFCNFIYSNSSTAHPIREKFFRRLCDYKKVDSGGRFLNNIGESVDDKLSFLSKYKFTIAFENSSVDGYTTEKLVEPMSVNSIPVYWGNPKIDHDFNKESFIVLENTDDREIEKTIDYIKYLDNNDEEYLNMLMKPWLANEQYIHSKKIIMEFFEYIFDQPYEFAKRRAAYGYNRHNRKRLVNKINKPSIVSRVKKKGIELFGQNVLMKLKNFIS